MAVDPAIFVAAATGLFGGGGFFAALKMLLDKRGSDRAVEEQAREELRDEMWMDREELRRDMGTLKKALLALTDLIDELLPTMGLPPEHVSRLRLANSEAKLAV